MEDCTHIHQVDEGLEKFKEFIREETDDGRTIREFFVNAMFDDAYRYLDGPWSYMRAVHSTMEGRILASDGHDLFIYDKDLGRYVPGEGRVRKLLADHMELEWSPTRVNDILTWFNDSSPRLWDPLPLDRVNVLNGILNLESGELEPHSPDFLSPIQISAAWDPEAECPFIDQFVQQVFPDDSGDIFYQLAGLFMVPDSRFRKAVMFLGPSATGKSLALTLLRTFLGTQNVSNIPLHDLTQGSFSLAEIRGKLLNISAEVSERDFDDTAVFKQIVDGQLAVIRAPQKHRDPIEFQPFARLIASANRAPHSADNSSGYLRRWTVVPFDNKFKDRDFDHTLFHMMTRPNELSGLLKRAVDGYHKVLSSGAISESASMAEAKEGFDLVSNSTRLFFDERVQECSFDEHVDRTELYRAYRAWCEVHRFNPVSAHRFYGSVWDVFQIETFRTSHSRLFKGIRLVPKTTPDKAEMTEMTELTAA